MKIVRILIFTRVPTGRDREIAGLETAYLESTRRIWVSEPR